MKKIILFTLLIAFGLIAARSAQAAFWSKWFAKKTEAPAAQQPISVVDKKKVEAKIHTIEEIAAGIYKGSKDVSISFTEEELKQVIIPLANESIKKAKQIPTSSLNNVLLPDNIIEIYGSMIRPVKGNFMVRIAPTSEKGKLKIEIDRIKFAWLNLPKSLIYKLMEMNKVKPEFLAQKLPNFYLSEITIKDKQITLKGNYQKD